jgi:cytochrome c-type biogenesis protein CcmE
MKNKRLKFGVGIAIILAVVVWEGISGFQQSKTYYFTVNELLQGKGKNQRVRVGGVVQPDSIQRHGDQVTFRLSQDAQSIPVTYVGSDTLPDTFKGGAQAIVEGDFTASGTFRAEKIQAKCASKYQAAPPGSAQQNSSKIETGNPKFETRNSKLEIGNSKLAKGN